MGYFFAQKMKLIVKGVKVIDKNSLFNNKVVDIYIVDNRIENIAEEIEVADTEIFNAKGLMISQGWVDGATHFKDPGTEWLDDVHSISRAAAAGGFTSVVGFPNTQPVIQTKEAISYFNNFNKNSIVQLYNLAAVTKDNKGADFTDMIDLKEGGAVGFSDGKEAIFNSDIFLKTLQYLEPLKRVLVVKSKDKYLSMYGQMHEGITSTLLGLKGIPSAAEELMILRDLKLLEYSEVKAEKSSLHFSTISTKGAVELIRNAKKNGLPVSCDVAAHHLVFKDEDLRTFDTKYKVYPPFRAQSDVEALKEGLADGTIDMIVSDHDAWDSEHKNLEFDAAEFGAVGLQTVFSVALENGSIEETIDRLVYAPSQIFGLEVSKIEIGQKANLTIFDTETNYNVSEEFIVSKGKHTPFLGKNLKGQAKAIINNGAFKAVNV